MKNNEQKRIYKIFWAWEDEKEEQWLEEQEMKGWRLNSVAPFIYQFKKGEPQKATYRLDYKNTLDKDYSEYKGIFSESGWELVTTMSNWHYYRNDPANSVVPELYNSDRAKSQKYRRLLAVLIPLLVIFSVILNPALNRTVISAEGVLGVIYGVSFVLRIIVVALLVFAVVQTYRKIRKLESSCKE